MCRTIKIWICQLLPAGKTVAFDFSHPGHALVTLYVQFLCSDWIHVSVGKILESKLVERKKLGLIFFPGLI